ENARLYERVTRRAAEQESLVEAGRLLTGTLQVSEVLQRLSELVRARLGADVARILIAEDAPGHFRLEAQAGTTRPPKLSRGDGGDPERTPLRGDAGATAPHRDAPGGELRHELHPRAGGGPAPDHAGDGASPRRQHRRRVARDPGKGPLRADRGLSRAEGRPPDLRDHRDRD